MVRLPVVSSVRMLQRALVYKYIYSNDNNNNNNNNNCKSPAHGLLSFFFLSGLT
jgi:hypothetical protein